MNSSEASEKEFLTKLTETVAANLTNPKFGVSMLARELGMSRSNLHRKVNSTTKLSVSQYINQIRLKKAREILRHNSNTVSEVAYKVGYSNVSYFIKCFHEYYGYSPGEVGKRDSEENDFNHTIQSKNNKLKTILIPTVLVVILVVTSVVIFKPFRFQQKKIENRIAILPPESLETNYSTAIDGIIQNVRNNLCVIKDIENVVPWLSVLQYRNSLDPAPEIANDLKVSYLVKPFIHSVQDKTILSLTLSDGPRDKLLKTFSYEIDSNNVTTIHLEICKDITDELDISITPEEQVDIEKLITSNKIALNYYWEGVELINFWSTGRKTDLKRAIICLEKALEFDDECAAAYAQLARTYYYLDYHWSDRSIPGYEIKFDDEINKFAEKAMIYDSQLDLSLMAKAYYYLNKQDNEMAIHYLERAVESNPNSILAIFYLCRAYSDYDDEKFIKYALKIIDVNFSVSDPSLELGKEVIYVQLGVKYRHWGFFEKALRYVDLAIETNPEYKDAVLQKSQIILDLEKEDNYKQSKKLLMELVQKDSSSRGAYTFLGLACYVMRDYQSANIYYIKRLELNEKKEDYGGRLSGRMAVICSNIGETEKAEEHIKKYYEYIETLTNSGTKCYLLISYYSFKGDTAKAIEQMKILSKYDPFYNRIRLFNDAPIYDNIRNLPEYQELLSEMEIKFWKNHERIKASMKEKALL